MMSKNLSERLGQRVREVWILWAKEQPNPKPSWLVPWKELNEPDKEVDRRIGCAIWGDCIAEHSQAIALFELNKQTTYKADVLSKIYDVQKLESKNFPLGESPETD